MRIKANILKGAGGFHFFTTAGSDKVFVHTHTHILLCHHLLFKRVEEDDGKIPMLMSPLRCLIAPLPPAVSIRPRLNKLLPLTG